ncbi:MAG: HD domain-containing phosphohydrolase [Bacillota bacterium]
MENYFSTFKKNIFDRFIIIILGITALFTSLLAEFEIVEPLIILFVIYASTKYRKKGIIFSTIFAVFVLGVQDLYSLEVNLIEFIFEVFIIIITAVYVFHSKTSIEKVNTELKERLKELKCLYNISRISEKHHTDISSLLTNIAAEIPDGYQYPEDTCVLIEYNGQEYTTEHFEKSEWVQKSEIIIDNQVKGYIKIYYTKRYPQEFNNSPFLKEEYDLINLLSKRISSIIKIIDQEKNLREQRNFLAITLNSIGDGVIVTDNDGKIKRLNQEAQKLTKWNIEKAKGKNITEIFNIINAKTRKAVNSPVKKVIETGKIIGLANHTKLIAKDGTEYHIADSASPIKDDNGNIYGVVLVFRNVTKEYNLRNEIKNQAEIFSNAVEEAPFPIMLHNDRGNVLEINDVWEDITGYSREEIPTIERWTEKAYGENKDSVVEHIRKIYSVKDKFDSGEFTIRTKNGDLRVWDFKSSHIGLDENGNDLYISMAIDITKRNRMEKRIKVLNRIYKTLSSINQIIVKENSVEDLIEQSTKAASQIGGYNTVWIAEVNKNKDELNLLSVYGRRCIFLKGKDKIRLNYDSDNLNIYEEVLNNDREIIINDDINSRLKGEHCGSIGVFPIRVSGEIWGLAVFCSDNKNRLDDKEIALLSELSADISIGIEKIVNDKKRLESEKEYRQLFEKSPIGIFKTTFSGKVKLINPAMAEMIGFKSTDEIYNYYNNLGRDLYVDPDKRQKFINLLERNGEVRNFIYQAYDKYKNIKWIEMNARISSKKKTDDFLIEGFAVDITERKQHEDKVAYMSFHDKLTGLYNRAYMEDMMKRIDTNRNLPISLIMADLNNLKLVNDSFGHSKGDKWIKTAAEVINKACRKEDVVARWGGDEFVVLLPETTQKESEKIIERINEVSSKNNLEMNFSIALGTATKNSEDENLFEILSTAEDRMYINKFANRESGRSIVLSSFLNTLKEKSHETESHVNRMTEMSKQFSERLNLDQKDRDKLVLLSLLHDIGKISIPEDILNKTDKLTEQEWDLIKTHPEAGYRIIESIPRFSHIAEDILHHHERWDGTGYPDRLKNSKIPLLSRILAVVDAYDVMISGRPYKKAMTQKEIIQELKRCSGTQFDPELVDIFLGILNEE